MTAKVEWDDEENTILRIDLAEGHSWHEYHEAVRQVVELGKQQPHRVDVIINNPYSLAPGNPLPHLRESIHQLGKMPNLGTIVSINSRRMPGLVLSLVDIVLRAYGVDSQQTAAGFVNTLEQARQRIHEDREKASQA